MDAKTRGDRGQGNPAERESGLFAFVLRTRQKWSAPSLTRVSYAPRAPRNSLHSPENDKKNK